MKSHRHTHTYTHVHTQKLTQPRFDVHLAVLVLVVAVKHTPFFSFEVVSFLEDRAFVIIWVHTPARKHGAWLERLKSLFPSLIPRAAWITSSSMNFSPRTLTPQMKYLSVAQVRIGFVVSLRAADINNCSFHDILSESQVL